MKGISQVITSALLLAIGVSVAGVYAQWAPDFSENATQKVVDQTNQDIKCKNAAIDIKDANYSKSATLATFELDNTGTINLYEGITIVTINSSSVTEQKNIQELEVKENRRVELNTSKKPDKIIASSKDCPRLEVEEDSVKIN